MFIRIQNTIISKQSIITIKPITSSVGKGRPEDEREWYVNVIQYDNEERFQFTSRKERDAEIERLWNILTQPY